MVNLNPSFKHYPEISDYVQKTFPEYKVNYFAIARVYGDGRLRWLNSDPAWAIHHLLTNKHPPSSLINFDDIQGKQLMYATENCDEVMGWQEGVYSDARERFKVKNLLTIDIKHEDYVDEYMIDLHLPNAIDIYLNQLPLIEQFFNSIKYQFKDLITDLEKDPFIAEDKYLVMRQLRKQSKFLVEGEHLLYHNDHFAKLSKREYSCLQCLAKGARLKEIALTLKISPRTVESYINNIKLKLGIHMTTELVKCYWVNRELSSD